jgi:hypothetical protein
MLCRPKSAGITQNIPFTPLPSHKDFFTALTFFAEIALNPHLAGFPE